MRILFIVISMSAFIAAPVLSPAIQAAEGPNSTSQRQQIDSGSVCVPCGHNDGLPSTGTFYGSDCDYSKRLCCWHHPTAIYHPEIYNYRYFFNIIGHETYSNSSNYRVSLPAAHQPKEILTPVPEPDNRLSQSAGSVLLSRPDQKKFQK